MAVLRMMEGSLRKKIVLGLLMALGLFVAGAIGAITVTTWNIVDYIGVATTPSNPTSGKGRLYYSTADSKLHCRTSSGGDCSFSGGGGGGACPNALVNQILFSDGTNCQGSAKLSYNTGTDSVVITATNFGVTTASGQVAILAGPTLSNGLNLIPGTVNLQANEAGTAMNITANQQLLISSTNANLSLGSTNINTGS
jgi:hypothetical protein